MPWQSRWLKGIKLNKAFGARGIQVDLLGEDFTALSLPQGLREALILPWLLVQSSPIPREAGATKMGQNKF